MSELKTYGDLKKLINGVINKQENMKIISGGKVFALDQILGFIPGASNAKSWFDFIKTAQSRPDSQKTNTWLDKLDVDDDMSRIVDDTVENGFMQTMAKTIEKENDTKPLELDFNMNTQMVNYLKQQYNQRTISGIRESNIYNKNKKMKNEQLKKLIKEEIKNILELDNAGQEKISGGDFNVEVTEFLRDLKTNKTNLDVKELKNLLDLFGKIVLKAREGTLNQTIEDRVIKALMLRKNQPNQPKI
jgi:hypothetical protein